MHGSTQHTMSTMAAGAVACALLMIGQNTLAQTVGPSSQDSARVISSVPVIQQVAVPRQVCTTQQVTVPGQRSGAGAAMGAIAGGAIGNSIGEGSGRAAATLLGLVGGAMLGNSIEGGSAPSVQNVQQCTTQTFYENRTIGYNVIYEYAGKQYQVQLPQDPGPTVRIQITPVSELPSGVTVPQGSVVTLDQTQPLPTAEPALVQSVQPAQVVSAYPSSNLTTSWGTPVYAAPAYPAPTYVAPSPTWSAVVPAVIVGSALYWGAHSWGYRPHGYFAPRPLPRPAHAYGGGHWGGGSWGGARWGGHRGYR